MKLRPLPQITLMKSLLPVLIVLIHCNFLIDVEGMHADISIFRQFHYFFDILLLRLAVPAFFAMSGFLFFRGFTPSLQGYRSKFKSRIHTLLIPYLVWNLVAFFILLIKASPALAAQFPQYQNFDFSILNILKGFWSIPNSVYPYDMPLWFIRNLIVIQLFTPLTGILLKYCKIYSIAIVFFSELIYYYFYIPTYSVPSSFLYFFCGAAFARYLPELVENSRYIYLWAIVYLLIAIPYLYSMQLNIDIPGLAEIRMICGIILIMKIASAMSEGGIKAPQLMQNSAFFVYVFHGLFLTVIRKGVCHILPPANNLSAFIDYALIFVILYGASVTAYLLLSKLSPAATRVLCGNR